MIIDSNSRSVHLDPRDAQFYENPYPYYHRIRAQVPVFKWDQYGHWCFSRHEDVSALLRDRRSARRFERDVLALEPTTGGLLVATTFVGFAVDVVRPTRLLIGEGVRTLVRSMLSQEGPKPVRLPWSSRA